MTIFTNTRQVLTKTGVLVAVSIPIFTAQLEKSREATDQANIRSAYAELVAGYLEKDGSASIKVPVKQRQSKWQCASNAASITIAEGKKSGGIKVAAKKSGEYNVKISSSGTVSVN